MELDKETPGLHTSGGPQTKHTKLDYSARFPTLAPPETGCGPLDCGALRTLPTTITKASFPTGLCGLHAPGQVEAIPTAPQPPAYWQVFRSHRLAAILK